MVHKSFLIESTTRKENSRSVLKSRRENLYILMHMVNEKNQLIKRENIDLIRFLFFLVFNDEEIRFDRSICYLFNTFARKLRKMDVILRRIINSFVQIHDLFARSRI
jgi:hypothetical protein